MSTYQAHKKAAEQGRVSCARLLSTSALTAASLLTFGTSLAYADGPSWSDLDTTSGSTTTEIFDSNTTNITINSGRAIMEGDLDIHAGDTVNVGVGQLIAIDRENDPTYIYGTLNCAGSCYVLDSDGTIFGDGSIVSGASIIASTGDLMNRAEFMAGGGVELGNFSDSSITIEQGATINVAEAGLAAFVSPFVSNRGVINAKLGTVAFAAGETVTIDMYGDGLVELEIQGNLEDALLENMGTISAEGGIIQMTALAAKDAIDNIINIEGIITVASAEVIGGKIILSGGDSGTVNIAGTLDASGTTGGSINITGENITVAQTTELYADGGLGSSQTGDGGRIDVIAQNHLDYRGSLYARGGVLGGNGGNAETSGYGILGYSGYADLSAVSGDMGTLLLDPSFVVIHSGFLNNPFGLGYVLADWALANSMANSNIIVQADDFIDVGTSWDAYDTGNAFLDNILNNLIGTGPVNLSTWSRWISTGTTNGNITFDSQIVNFNKDVYMGNGNLGVDAAIVNLDSVIYDVDQTTALGEARLFSNAGTVNVLSNAALIQQGIYLSNDDGGATVNVAADTYTENLVIDRALTLVGAGATFEAAFSSKALINVTASNVTIDPFIFDGMGLVNYGIYADGAAADGLVVDGNTFKNFNKAGIYVANITGGEASIVNNIFEGSSTRGIEAGTLGGGFALNLTDNIVGTNGDEVLNGFLFGRINNAVLNISGGSINSSDDGIHFAKGLHSGADVNISNIVVTSGDEAIDLQKSVRSGATFDIIGGSYTGGNNGIEFGKIAGDVTLSGATINGNGANKRGLNLLGAISGLLEVIGGSITGGDDAIGSNNNQNNIADGGTVTITGTTLVGISGDGIELGAVMNGADINISGVDITAGANGINFVNGIDASTVDISSSTIVAGLDGISFGGGSPSVSGGSVVTIDGNTISADDVGIEFEDDVDSSTLNITNNNIGSAGGEVNYGVRIREINNSIVAILGNTIFADNHGLDLRNDISGSDVDIHSNIINANLDNGIYGAGIYFGGAIDTSTIDIGNGFFSGNHSTANFITVNSLGGDTTDGIYFEGDIGAGADIEIDGNRIGYIGTPGEPGLVVDAVAGDGIEFAGNISDDAQIRIVDNRIAADGNGIVFSGMVGGSANIVIGDTPGDENSIISGDNGIAFLGYIQDNATVSLGYNDITAGGNGIETNGVIGASLSIINNLITATLDGVHFGGGSPSVSGGANVMIVNNTINADHDGVYFADNVDGSTVTISGNSIVGGEDGIQFSEDVTNGSTITISNNALIEGETDDGIVVDGQVNGSTFNITGNTDITGSDRGVSFSGGIANGAIANVMDNTLIESKNIDGVLINAATTGSTVVISGNTKIIGDDEGIDIEDIANSTVTISGNTDIIGTNGDGIEFEGPISAGSIVTVSSNSNISGGDNGINFMSSITGGSTISITNNNDGISGATDGIVFSGDIDNADIDITGNIITGGENGVKMDNIDLSGGTTVNVDNNTSISGGTGDGVIIHDNVAGGASVRVSNNLDITAGDDGINLANLTGVIVDSNIIHDVGGDGIFVRGSDSAQIINNNISNAGDDGIDVRYSDYAYIYLNEIDSTGLSSSDGEGIQLAGSDNVTIDMNIIENAGADGIDSDSSNGLTISNNFIYNSGDDGIDIDGGDNVTIDNNIIDLSSEDGIDADDVYELNILNNVISNSLQAGIHTENIDVLNILNNDVSNNGEYGLWVGGPSHGNVVLAGNTFTDNPIGALFESGELIDLTGEANTFNGGDIGMLFRPFEGFSYPDNFEASVGGEPTFAEMNLVGNTIGTTIFNGQSTYFIELDNGAFFNPGTPTILNAMNATFNGFNPGALEGVLTQTQIDFLSDRLFDFSDRGDLGLFFFGDTASIENVEDFFNQFALFGSGAGGINITVTGLPPIGITGGGPADLAGIEPAAGGDEEGGAVENLANVEPAAGENDAACWGDVANIAGGGTPVNYSFGGSLEESLADASNCGLQTF